MNHRHGMTVAALLCAALAVSGCGQMGPLYFDEDPPADQLPPSRKKPAVAPAPAAPAPVSVEPAAEDAAEKK